MHTDFGLFRWTGDHLDVYGSAGCVRPGKEMAIGRSRYAPPYMSTKGHSVLKQRSYSSPRSVPTTTGFSRASAYDTRAEERFLTDRVSNVNFLSNSLMDEGYDTAVKSRGRDQQLLKEATNAIVSAESYATPQTSVASRRVARGQSITPRAASVPPRSLRPEVDSAATVIMAAPAPAPIRPIIVLPNLAPRGNQGRAGSVPPGGAPSTRSSYVGAVASSQQPLPTAGLRAHRTPRRFLTRSGMQGYYEKPDVVATARVSGVPYALPRPRPAPVTESLRGFPKVYVPSSDRPSNRSKAAIIASKMEPDPLKRRRPRSEYAANKYRELRKESLEGSSRVSPQSKSTSGSSERRRH